MATCFPLTDISVEDCSNFLAAICKPVSHISAASTKGAFVLAIMFDVIFEDNIVDAGVAVVTAAVVRLSFSFFHINLVVSIMLLLLILVINLATSIM